jgi:serine/threonine protein kinase
MRAGRFEERSDADVKLADDQARKRCEFAARQAEVGLQVRLGGVADRGARPFDPTRHGRRIHPKHRAQTVESHALHEVEAQQCAVPLGQSRERGPIRRLEFIAITPLQIGQLRIVGIGMRLGGCAIFQACAVVLGSPDQQSQSLSDDREPGSQRPAPSIAADAGRFLGRTDEQALVQRLPDLGAERWCGINPGDTAIDDGGAGVLERFESPGDIGGAGRGQIEIGATHRGQCGRQIHGVAGNVTGDVAREQSGVERQFGPFFLATPKQLLQRHPYLQRQWRPSCLTAGRAGRPGLGEGRRHDLGDPFGGVIASDRGLWAGLWHEGLIPLTEPESNNRDYRQSLSRQRVQAVIPGRRVPSDRDSVAAGVSVERDSDIAGSAPDACPDEQVVLDLALGALPPQTGRLIWAHVGKCEDCARLIGAALPFLGPETPGHAAWQTAWKRQGQATDPIVTEPPNSSADDTVPGPNTNERSERRSLQAGQDLRNRYRIVRYVGCGAMGEVFEARHARLEGRYAVKILNVDLTRNQAALQRFRREAAIASELRHPNIVQVIDFDETEDGRPYLVMELLEGHDLGALLARGALPVERALALTRQIAAGLSAMHERNVVHRDLKPANVFVLPPGTNEPERVKLLDFGLSKRLAPSFAVTHDRMLLGTPQYMAPEQAQGSAEGVGPAADQFAMAAIVYEMLAGRPAFDGDLLSVVLYRIVYESPPPLAQIVPGLSPHIATAITRALAKDPNQRFRSVNEFQTALEGDGQGYRAVPSIPTGNGATSWASAPPGARVGRLKWWGLASSVTGGGLALWWMLTRPQHPPRQIPEVAFDRSRPQAQAQETGTRLGGVTTRPVRAPTKLAIEKTGVSVPIDEHPRKAKPIHRTATVPKVLTTATTTESAPDSAPVESPAAEEARSSTVANDAPDAGAERVKPLVPHL